MVWVILIFEDFPSRIPAYSRQRPPSALIKLAQQAIARLGPGPSPSPGASSRAAGSCHQSSRDKGGTATRAQAWHAMSAPRLNKPFKRMWLFGCRMPKIPQVSCRTMEAEEIRDCVLCVVSGDRASSLLQLEQRATLLARPARPKTSSAGIIGQVGCRREARFNGQLSRN